MIKIDWTNFIRHHVWFGWRAIPSRRVAPDYLLTFEGPIIRYMWNYSRLWSERLWPVYYCGPDISRRKASPVWWLSLIARAGLDK